jgi:hypothetical protein
MRYPKNLIVIVVASTFLLSAVQQVHAGRPERRYLPSFAVDFYGFCDIVHEVVRRGRVMRRGWQGSVGERAAAIPLTYPPASLQTDLCPQLAIAQLLSGYTAIHQQSPRQY